MKKILFLISAIFAGSVLFGEYSIKNQIKFTPLRILNYTAPGLEFSYERDYGDYSSQISAAYLIDFVHYIKVRSELNGVRLNFEQKYFPKRFHSQTGRLYYSAKIGYNHMKYVANEVFRNSITNERYWSKYNKQSQSFIGSANVGLQGFIGQFVLDFSVGLSIISKHVKDSNKPADEELLLGLLNGVLEVEGNRVRFNVPISCKIGYRF